jgi:hypothetical protein
MVDLNRLFNEVVNKRAEELLRSSEVRLIQDIKTQGNIQQAARDNQIKSIQEAETTTAKIAETNAAILKHNLGLELEKLRKESSRVAGTQRAQAASTGFDINSGSYLLLYNEAAENADKEAINMITNSNFSLNKLNLETSAQIKTFQTQKVDIANQKETDRLKTVAQQYSALTQFLNGQIFKSDYALAGASNAVRNKLVKSILG